MNEWTLIVQQLGVPVAILMAMGLGIFKAFRWAAPIGHKLAEKHGSLVDKLETYLDKTSTMLESQAKHLDGQQQVKLQKLNEIHGDVKAVHLDVRSIGQDVRSMRERNS